MDIADITLIFLIGYLLKDMLYAILIGITFSYIIGKQKLYQITINIKYLYYTFIIFIGIIQSFISTITTIYFGICIVYKIGNYYYQLYQKNRIKL